MAHIKLFKQKKLTDRLPLIFHPAGIPSKTVCYYFERGDELRYLVSTIGCALESYSCHSIIVAGYGNGKTHTLQYLWNSIRGELDQKPRIAKALYINVLGESLHSLYVSMMISLGEKELTDLVWEFLARCTVEMVDRGNSEGLEDLIISKEYSIKNLAEDLTRDPHTLRKLVKEGKVVLSNIMEITKEEANSLLGSTDYLLGLFHLVLPEFRFLAWKWLSGDPIPYALKQRLGISGTIKTDEEVLRGYLSLRNFLSYLGYRLLVLLIDEFEVVATHQLQKRQKILNGLRHLIDLQPDGLSIIFACSPEVWSVLVDDYHAFTDRILYEVMLPPLRKDQIQAFLELHLEEGLNKEKKSLSSSEFPFDDDFVEELTEITGGNLRQILKVSRAALDYAETKGIEKIGKNVLEDCTEHMFGLFPSNEED